MVGHTLADASSGQLGGLIRRRSRPGEGAGGGHPARGYGGAL